MPIISSNTLITSMSLLHLVCAYCLVRNPGVVTGHNLVVVISAAVNLPVSNSSKPDDDFLALLAAVLALYALADIAAISLREEVAAFYWQSQATIRLLFFFGLTAFSYSYRPGGIFAGRADSVAATVAGKVSPGGIGSGLVFTWGFLGMVLWFWTFITLRDERRERRVVEST